MKKMLLVLALAGISVLYSFTVSAQQKTITGKVISSQDGSTLPGVTVRVKGTRRGTSTSPDGQYKIQASQGEVLDFSYIGYQQYTVTVGADATINVTLKPSQAALGEVVVTAMGQQQEERKLGYAVQKISGDDIENTHRDNFTTALQGRVAGLSVTSTSGLPGASSSIQLRGINSIGLGNSPLFIVDGVPVDNSTMSTTSLTAFNNSAADYANRRFDFSNRIADVNPNDIESITVLKGPEATALYGIDATSGAIVITTKKGKAGKMVVDYGAVVTTTNVYRFPETQQVYDKGSGGILNPATSYFMGPKIDPTAPKFDNIHNFFRTGLSQTHNLSLSGGNDRVTYRLSSSYLNNKGVVPTTKLERINVSLKTTAQISDKLRMDASLSYIQTDNVKAEKGPTSFLMGLYLWPSYSDVRDYLNPDGSRLMIDPELDPDGEFENPFFAVNKNHFYDKTRRSITNVGFTYDPLNWLTLSGRIGNDAYTTNGMIYYNANSIHGYPFGGRIDQYTTRKQNLYTQLFAKVHKDFGKWNSSLLVGNAYYDYKTNTDAQSGEDFQVNDFVSLNIATPLSIQNLTSMVEKRLIGVFGEFNIGYGNIFNLQITGRNDWTSTLPIGNNHFFYPSANASFAFTELPALSRLKSGVFTFGKIRASIAQVGKDAPPYQISPALLPQTTTGGGFAYNFNGPSPFLVPEQTTSHSFGTHLEFYSGRITADVEYYKTKSIHQIVPLIRKSYIPGFVLYTINGGSLTNHGMEVTLTGRPIETQNLRWEITVNYAFNRSKLLSLPDGVDEFYNSDTWLAYNVRNGMRVGGSLTTFTGATWARNNKGQILISPTTGNPIKESNWAIIGDRNPDFTGGITNSFRWKNLDFSFLFDFRKGGDVYNASELSLYRRGMSIRTLNRETPVIVKGVLQDGLENTAHPTVNTIQITPYFANSSSGFYTATSVESDYIEKDINWIRLRDIRISYLFPKQWLGKQHTIKALSVGVSTSNLFIITNYLGQDPDVNGNTSATLGSGGGGMDYNVIGTPRVINFTLDARF